MVERQQHLKVSIIIPVYNVEGYIKKTLCSIINQTFKDFEIIIVNDGSSDRTIDIVESILSQSMINYMILNQKNNGVSSARNKGLSKACGEYVFFIDGDDYVSNSFLEKMYSTMVKNEVDCVMCGGNIVDEEDGNILPYQKSYRYFDNLITGEDALFWMLKKDIWIYVGNAIYKKEIIDKHNLNFSIHNTYGEDQEFTLKFLAHSDKVACVKEVMFYYVKRKKAATENVSFERFNVVEVFYSLIHYLKSLNYIKKNIINYIYSVRIPEERILILYLILKEVKLKKVNFHLFDQFPIKEEFKRYVKSQAVGKNFKLNQSIKIYLLNEHLFVFIIRFQRLLNK
ncbi:glycosyltransferase family 2 protein [Gracilibacillus salinarum]|uniref:Glycosyltransferase n=1 Tax=Gracilibacillus salinarum TaxID=2932255 RepID=A0ABY4GRZ6_9BACI|nr:glycosyltransferase family 2 protein [Gracilibacillus salinarum]UOQ87014.1 glycosyltransferase [Gracilibacillus salinarum]